MDSPIIRSCRAFKKLLRRRTPTSFKLPPQYKDIDWAIKIESNQKIAALDIPDAISAIAEKLHTQDNLYTAHVCYEVQKLERIYGMDEEFSEGYIYLHEGETYEDACELREHGIDPQDCDRAHFVERWSHVTTYMTLDAARERVKRHGGEEAGWRVFGESWHRNHEMIAVRDFLMSLHAAEGADS